MNGPAATGPGTVGLIWAQTEDGVIGVNGSMPWHLPEDLAHFKHLTWGHPVVMGRRTWDSLPANWRPLPGRANLVLTRQTNWSHPAATAVASPAEAIASAIKTGLPGPLWVIGGGHVYRLFEPLAGLAEVTIIDLAVSGDTTAPKLAPTWRCFHCEPPEGWLQSASGLRYKFESWHHQPSSS